MTNHRSEPDSAPGDDEPYEYRGRFRAFPEQSVDAFRPVARP